MPVNLEILCGNPHLTQQFYRYGIALSCFGVLLNWLGVAHVYVEPVRYLGVGLVIVGSTFIVIAICRWMFFSQRNAVSDVISDTSSNSLSAISVPMPPFGLHPRPQRNFTSAGKPPDYHHVTENDKPPTYEEAVAMMAASVQVPEGENIVQRSDGKTPVQGVIQDTVLQITGHTVVMPASEIVPDSAEPICTESTGIKPSAQDMELNVEANSVASMQCLNTDTSMFSITSENSDSLNLSPIDSPTVSPIKRSDSCNGRDGVILSVFSSPTKSHIISNSGS